MADPFKDKVSIVTGGASGIGRALCHELGRQGAKVVVSDVNFEGASEVAGAILSDGGTARARTLDVTSAEHVQERVRQTAEEFGRLDYMFNNAGIAVQGETRDIGPEHWQRIMDINFRGVLHGTLAAYDLMIKQGFGHIINTASVLGLVGMPLSSPYATTKHAIVGLSTSLRAEGSDLGVKVSAVCPGFVQTALYETATIPKVDNKSFYSLVPFKKMCANKAAKVILKNVERNRAFIVFPLHARFTWWLHRLHPDLLARANKVSIKKFREIREKSERKND